MFTSICVSTFEGQIILFFSMLSATQSLCWPQESTSALSWLWSPCPDMALGNMSLILRSVRMNWTNSGFVQCGFKSGQVVPEPNATALTCIHPSQLYQGPTTSAQNWDMSLLWFLSGTGFPMELRTWNMLRCCQWFLGSGISVIQWYYIQTCWLLNKYFSKDCTKLSVQQQVLKLAHSSLKSKDYCKSFAK